jgi:sterol 3beta-glucosyltransferase
MIAAAGAGPLPIHHQTLNQENLTQAIQYCMTPAARTAAAEISEKMRRENGIQTAVRSFHTNLPVEALRCGILPDQVAVWRYSIKNKKQPKKYIKLSDEAAFELVERKKIDPKRLKL